VGSLRIAVAGFLSISAFAQPAPSWKLTRSAHFELYSQGGDAAARSTLQWFEQLRAFYIQTTGLATDSLPAVRVIAFRSAREYEPYRLGAASDAHFVGTESREYIVLASLGAGEFQIAAHEYAHAVLHGAGLRLPAWLGEGLAEFFSTVWIAAGGVTVGGDLPARTQTLERRTWIPLAQLLGTPEQSSVREDRDTANVFYSECWALADMLMLSPDYGSRFGALLAALTVGTSSERALAEVYGRSLDAVAADLHGWVATKHTPIPLSGIQFGETRVGASEEVSPQAARAMLGDLLAAAGELGRAEAIYRDLAREAPDATVFAALGNIALRTGDRDRAREEWKRAIASGINDPKLCYQYAALAEMAGLPDSDFRAALERAVALKPDFDDARYMLALVQKNAGEYAAAVGQLRAIRHVAPARAYHYWMAMANALVELDRREEAEEAAKHALEDASNAAERRSAEQIVYIAQTDLAVQFSSGVNGRVELQTTRVPHETTDFNPFVEPGDEMRHVEGTLREIDCEGQATRFIVETAGGRLTLAILDPGRVEMRNAPPEFTCGPQEGVRVAVDYAVSAKANAAGIVRRMEFP